MIKNKQVISTFNFGYGRLTLKKGPKVISEHIRRFLAHDLRKVGFTLQNTRTKNKRVISTLNLAILA